MSEIKILSEQVANRIAAGEVIERPASIVKELVENSIDAGATKISVSIENAGGKLISVTDNGKGMDADDALLCLEQHGTSKILSESDILNISSFGFRGEAIPSIASISRFTIRTKQQNNDGTEVVVIGGKLVANNPVGCAPGTEIIVRDIFFNTPARKKFLKTPATEERHIQETLYALALPYPEVSLEFFIDNRKVFFSPAHSDLIPRLQTFFGSEMASSMIPISYSNNDISVKGYIAKHGYTRPSRREQRTYVNGRPIESSVIYRGIKDGYMGLLERGRFAPVVLFVTMPSELVDINVHPAKREVRFKNELNISSTIKEGVSAAIKTVSAPTITVDANVSFKNMLDTSNVYYKPKPIDRTQSLNFAPSSMDIDEIASTATSTSTAVPSNFAKTIPNTPSASSANEEQIHNSLYPNKVTTENSYDNPEQTIFQEEVSANETSLPGSGALEILGVLDETYIVAKGDSGLIIIDQHAAHERVLFERILAKTNNDVSSQSLLIPITLELTPIETRFVDKTRETFSDIGFDIEAFGENTVIITAIPTNIKQNNIKELITEILDNLLTKGESKNKIDKNIIARAACRAAVKAHDKMNDAEIKELLQDMTLCELPFACPHGRPTVINVGMKELEKRFSRT